MVKRDNMWWKKKYYVLLGIVGFIWLNSLIGLIQRRFSGNTGFYVLTGIIIVLIVIGCIVWRIRVKDSVKRLKKGKGR